MKVLSFFKLATLLLVILNLVVIGLFLLGNPKGPGQGMDNLPPRDMGFRQDARQILRLDDEQQGLFRRSADEQRRNMRELDREIAQLMRPYFLSLADPSRKMESDSIYEQLYVIEKKKIEVTRQHFEEIRDILREDQLPHYDDFLRHVMDRILKQPKNPPPRPRDF